MSDASTTTTTTDPGEFSHGGFDRTQQEAADALRHQGEYVGPRRSVMPPDVAALLRKEFEPAQIGKLPRVTCRECSRSDSRVCGRHQKAECRECGNYMSTAHIHLDYVGHAAVTDRLLKADPDWTWEPVAYGPDGLPAIQRGDRVHRLWIRLTIAGVSRLGVGTAEARKDEVEKELISDAIRNAAMRFGVALDLWSKEDLHDQREAAVDGPPPAPAATSSPGVDPSTVDQDKITEVTRRIDTLTADQQEAFRAWKDQQGFPWPWPKAACAVMLRQMDALTGEGSQDPEGDATAAQGPAAPPEGSTAPEDPAERSTWTQPPPPPGAGTLPPADDVPVDGPCEICGSTRAAKAIVRGVRRCANATDCRKRAEAKEAEAAANPEPEPEASGTIPSDDPGGALAATDFPAMPGPGTPGDQDEWPLPDGDAEPGETGDEVLTCSLPTCGQVIGPDDLPVFGEADEPYHVACAPAFGGE